MKSRLDKFTMVALILVILSIALTYNQKISWVGHALAGTIGMLLMIIALAFGAMMSGRIKKKEGNLYRLHKRTSLYFGFFLLAAFLYELWLRLEHNRPLLHSVHGRLSLIIVIILLLQLIPGLAIKNRSILKTPHKVLGYALAPLVIADIVWGLYGQALYGRAMAGANNLVLIHSISGGLAALALTWFIVELSYPTEKGIIRARAVSYLASFIIIAGCWIVGGYNYLTAYSASIKPIILSGSKPWAHAIVMETKEHVFLFLPIIALALSFTINVFAKDTLASDSKSRHAMIAIASLALFIILLMFFMGAIISNAGKGGGLR